MSVSKDETQGYSEDLAFQKIMNRFGAVFVDNLPKRVLKELVGVYPDKIFESEAVRNLWPADAESFACKSIVTCNPNERYEHVEKLLSRDPTHVAGFMERLSDVNRDLYKEICLTHGMSQHKGLEEQMVAFIPSYISMVAEQTDDLCMLALVSAGTRGQSLTSIMNSIDDVSEDVSYFKEMYKPQVKNLWEALDDLERGKEEDVVKSFHVEIDKVRFPHQHSVNVQGFIENEKIKNEEPGVSAEPVGMQR